MARYSDDYRRNSIEEWDDADGWYDEEDDWVDPVDSRSLVALTESQELEVFDAEIDEPPEVLVIPGGGLPTRAVTKRRRRPLTMQILLLLVLGCIILSGYFTFTPLSDPQNSSLNAFTALANSANLSQSAYFLHRALPGETFTSMASTFDVLESGIYELNKLTASDEAIVGNVYKIPTDSKYGESYAIPLPPGIAVSGAGLTATNYYGSSTCMFCAHGGLVNDKGTPQTTCASGAFTGAPIGNTSAYALVNPDPSSNWVRGFYEFHDGVDISTGHDGTPILAAQVGEVIYAGWDEYGSGWAIKINHCGGMATSYSHLQYGSLLVKVGDIVAAGQQIANQGNTGDSFGSHLHFMVWWDNVPIDPLCAFGTLDGVNTAYPGYPNFHYGGCPPTLTSNVWDPQPPAVQTATVP